MAVLDSKQRKKIEYRKGYFRVNGRIFSETGVKFGVFFSANGYGIFQICAFAVLSFMTDEPNPKDITDFTQVCISSKLHVKAPFKMKIQNAIYTPDEWHSTCIPA